MANAPEADKNKASADDGQTLQPRSEADKVESKPKDTATVIHKPADSDKNHRHLPFRPSHKATFIGLAVVIVILAINAGVLGFLLTKENANQKALSDKGVSISPGELSKLGVNDSQIGTSNEKLTVDPAAQFNSALTVAGNVQIGGQLLLNSTLNATSANLSQLQAGTTTVNSININGSATASTLSVRGNFAVNGAAQFQNAVTVSQLFSVNSSAAVSSNLSVGGQISTTSVAAGSIVVSGSIELGGHVVTAGRTPSLQVVGTVLGATGSANISGNDIAGTINLNVAAGAGGSGPIVYVLFHAGYSTNPVVVISPSGNYGNFYTSNITTSGFDIDGSGISSGTSYTVNYMVEQ